MRELTVNAEAARAASFNKPRLIVEIDPDRDGTWTLKYSDQDLTIGSDTYLPWVQAWQAHQTKLDHHVSADEVARLSGLGRIDDLQIKFKNSDYPAEKFHTICTQNDVQGAPIRFGVHFVGNGTADIVWLSTGIVNAIIQTSIEGTDIDAVELGAARTRDIPENDINRDDFPEASESVIGRKVPLIFGEVEKFPAISVTTGQTTELYGAHGTDDTTIRVYSVEGFPASGTLLIDAEQITYTSVDTAYNWLGTTVQAFLGCTREANGTEKVFHQHGVEVSEQLSETVFVMADHACKVIDMVRVAGQLADTADFTINKNNTTLVSGRTLTTITFNGRPKYLKRSEAVEAMKAFPDTEGSGNENEDYAKTFDEVEANTWARVGEAEGPLVVKRTLDVVVGETIVEGAQQVIASHDAGVRKTYPTTNYGSFSTVEVLYSTSYGDAWRSYLRLDATDIPAEYSAVALKIYCSGGPQTVEIKATEAASTWTEGNITWNTQPNGTGDQPSGSLITSFMLNRGGWNTISLPLTVDLTKGVILWTADDIDINTVFRSSEHATVSDRPYFEFSEVAQTQSTGDRQAALLAIHAGIEFSTDATFLAGDLQMRVERAGLSMSWVDLWSPKYNHVRPATDTLERSISSQVADVESEAQSPTHDIWFNQNTVGGSGDVVTDSSIPFAVDSSWSTSMKMYSQVSSMTGKSACDLVKFKSTATPPAGTIQRVRCRWMATNQGFAGNANFWFYLGGTLIHMESGVSDGARHYSSWIDVSSNNWDMETILTDYNKTYILVSVGGSLFIDEAVHIEMCRMEVEYEAEAGSSGEPTVVTTTNFVDLVAVGAIDASGIADPWDWFVNTSIAVQNVSFSGEFKVFNLWFEIRYLPIELVPSDDVTADVQGIEDTGDGTGALLTNPADIIEHIMKSMLGFVDSEIDATAFAAAQSLLDDFGAVFGFGLRAARDTWEILAELAAQARCWLRCDGVGKYHLDFRPLIYSSPVRTIGSSGVTGRMPGSGRFQYLGRDGIANDITLLFAQDYTRDTDPFAESVTVSDAVSQTKYKVRHRRIEAWAIRDPLFAESLAYYMLARDKNERMIYIEDVRLGNIDLEPADIIASTISRWGMTAEPGEIVQIRFLPGAAEPLRANALELYTLIQPVVWDWSDGDPDDGGGGIFVGESQYLVINGQTVARLTKDGRLYIKGVLVGDQTLPAASGNPIAWDAARQRMQFALTGNTTVFEVDGNGHVYVGIDELENQTLSFAGVTNEANSDATKFWINIDGARSLEIEADGLLKLPQFVVEDARAAQLL